MGFSGDALVFMADGTLERIDRVKVGDEVFSINSEVGRVMSIDSSYSDKLSILKMKYLPSTYLDKNTLILTSRLVSKGLGEVQTFYISNKMFKLIEKVSPVDLIAIPKINIINNENYISDKSFWLYGKILSRGYVEKSRDFQITIEKSNSKIVEYRAELPHYKIQKGINKKYQNIYIREDNNIDIFKVNKKTHNKQISSDFMFSSEKQLKKLLKSFIKETTTQNFNDNEFRIYTDSRYLSFQILYILANLTGKIPSIEEIKRDDVYGYSNHLPSYKKKIYAIYFNSNKKNSILSKDIFWSELSVIKNNQSKRMKTYGLNIESNMPYICNGLLTIN